MWCYACKAIFHSEGYHIRVILRPLEHLQDLSKLECASDLPPQYWVRTQGVR